jgi:chromosome partitioning protein
LAHDPEQAYDATMIVSLVSQKGGVGKSSLALALAWELAARKARVLLADTDPQATARSAGELAAAQGLEGPTTLSFGKDLSRPNQLPAIAQQFDHVIIDTPGKLTDVTTPVLIVSDVAIIPIGPSPAELWSNADTISIVQAARESFNQELRAAIAFVRNEPKTVLSTRVRETLEKGELPVLRTSISQRVAWREAMLRGQGVAQFSPRDRAAVEVRALVDELLVFGGAGDQQEVAHG